MKTNHPSVKEILQDFENSLVCEEWHLHEENPELYKEHQDYDESKATQALEARFRAMMEEVVGQNTMVSPMASDQTTKRAMAENTLRRTQRQRIDQVIKENF